MSLNGVARPRTQLGLVITLAVLVISVGAHGGTSSATISSEGASRELQDREVDQVALGAQDIAISRLQTLLKKYRNTSQESVFLAKLADLLSQKAAIQFRLAHGAASHSHKPVNLSAHHKTTEQSIAALDRLISRYPNYEDIPHAYFLRGKNYEEIENKAKAGQDYLYLVNHFPNCDDSTVAYMSLADFAIEANDHARAIGFLKEVEKRPEDPHYPFALYKMAWSYYNLKNIPQALSYAQRQVAYYDDRAKHSETPDASDSALRENTLLDIATFYFEGYEEKLPAYAVDNALGYFKKLEKSSILGKMILRFAKLLRSHAHEEELLAWKKTILASESSRPESLDVLSLTYEFELNNRHYPRVVECAQDMASLYALHPKYESFPKVQKQVLDTAQSLQTLIVKNKAATEAPTYSRILAQLYQAFVHMVEETDPRIPRAHYNLAETLFTIQDYAGATEHYRWVVEHGKWGQKTKSGEATVLEASLKAIASQYEVLRKQGLIPKELAAKALPSKDPKSIDSKLEQWVSWLDTHLDHSAAGTDNFVFESNRAIYSQGQIHRAVERMTRFAQKHPKSQYAVPQASLVLDTYIASQDWEKTHDTATDFMDVDEWKQGEFSKKLFVVASDAFYKRVEENYRKRDYKEALSLADKFLKRYSASTRLGDTLALAGSAALEGGQRKRAVGYFTRLIDGLPKSPHVPMALLARASMEDEHYLFSAAVRDYRAYLSAERDDKSADTKKLNALREKILVFSWLSGDRAELKSVLADKTLCIEKLATQCEQYSILSKIEDPSVAADGKTTDEAFDKARRDSTGDNRGLYAVLALENQAHLGFRDRNLAATLVAKNWGDLDPLVKFALVPRISEDLVAAFHANRVALNTVAPLKADAKWITHRVDCIREIENAATRVMKLPWSRVRAEVLNEMAGVYLDLARGLAALPQPKGMTQADQEAYDDTIRKITMPFEEKGQDMRAKAFEIASRFAIEDAAFTAIAEPFFAENPSQAKKLRGETVAKPGKTPDARVPASVFTKPAPEPLDLRLLADLDSGDGWSSLAKHPDRPIDEDLAYDDSSLYLRSLWARAIQTKRFAQIAFFMQEAHEKKALSSGALSAVKAVSLATAGARGEGLTELDDARGDLPSGARDKAARVLADYYERAYQK